jgi:hypothetical protein
MIFSRRSFVSRGGSSLALLGALGAAAPPVHAQLVYRRADWNFKAFDSLLKSDARAKQVYDIRPIGEGRFLNNIKNSINGFQFGFDIPANQIKIVSAMHGPSNLLNFDDAMWEKYRLGEFLQVTDPKTGKPATRNIYYRRNGHDSSDPEDRASRLQDTSMEALQGRGVQFLSCHTATEEQAQGLLRQYAFKAAAEEIVRDLQAHTMPGVLIVPAMVAAVSLLQSDGHYSYITV